MKKVKPLNASMPQIWKDNENYNMWVKGLLLWV